MKQVVKADQRCSQGLGPTAGTGQQESWLQVQIHEEGKIKGLTVAQATCSPKWFCSLYGCILKMNWLFKKATRKEGEYLKWCTDNISEYLWYPKYLMHNFCSGKLAFYMSILIAVFAIAFFKNYLLSITNSWSVSTLLRQSTPGELLLIKQHMCSIYMPAYAHASTQKRENRLEQC